MSVHENFKKDYPEPQSESSQTIPPEHVLSYPTEKAMMIHSEPRGIVNDLSHPFRENCRDGGRRTSPQTNTLFVGDLPVLCDEEKLFNVFYRFGEIEVIQLKKNSSNPQRNHLSYGFVKFALHESAVRAFEEMNGFPFYGRNLRLGWADDRRGSNHHQKHPAVEVLPSRKILSTAQIHVSFIAKNMTQPISEMDLRRVFYQFGNLVDVAIKKSNFNQVAGVQSGYGFVHFALTEEGIQSAFTAVEVANRLIMQGISFECTVTHELKMHLLSLRSHHGPPLPVFAPITSQPNVLAGNPDRQIHHSYPFHIPLQQYSHPSFDQSSTTHVLQPQNDPQATLTNLFGGSIASELHDSFSKSGQYRQHPPHFSGNGMVGDSRSSLNEDQLRFSSIVSTSSSSSSSFQTESFRMYKK